jgi:8-oxo-dGTP pyrophosphatase MutT (NUDIX family)
VTDATSSGSTKWKTFGERVIYDNPWVWLGQVDVELPDGERFWHHVVRLHRAAMMVLLDEQGRVLLLWRHRFVQDRWGWELPGGLVDEGEEPAETAARELEEETGYRAGRVLEATSGMRRCELAGARRDLLDLDAGTLAIETTRVVVDGRVIESDGKTENAQHVLALDPFTLAALKVHVEKLDPERRELGPYYHDHGVLFCWEDGRPPHPDTITRRFKQLAAAAGLPEIDLHDVRHYADGWVMCPAVAFPLLGAAELVLQSA